MRDTQRQDQFKIALIGESCIDVYHYGETTRLSPEGPVPVFVPMRTEEKVGMAENVKNNLISLGNNVLFVTCDKKIKKERFIDERFNSQVLRVDHDFEISPITENMIKKLELSKFDAVVVSDYCNGFLPEKMCRIIVDCAGSKPVFIDTKKSNLSCFDKSNCFIKVNQLERSRVTAVPKNAKLIVTLGKNGASFEDKNIPGFKTDVFDVCGAGDVFLSGMSHAHLGGNSLENSVMFGNLMASISLNYIGNHTVSTEEIKKRLRKEIEEEESKNECL